MTDPRTLGSRLRTMREAKELSFAQVAAKAGLTKAYVERVERDRVNPSVKTVEALAGGLGCSPGWLAFGGDQR
jgi:transcriptional regulator with XRE-family HTH domain